MRLANALMPTAASMLTLLVFTLLGPARGDAATLTVCAGGCGYATIAAAVAAASAGDTINIQDAVDVEANITIGKNLTIQGRDAPNTAVDGGGSGPIFVIGAGVKATFRNLTVRNAGGLNFFGGGILNSGTTTISRCTLADNSAFGYAGGIYNEGTITISDSAILDNSAANLGGGILNIGTATISNSTLSGNIAQFYGGAIFNEGTTTISNSTLSDNITLVSGGGIANFFKMTVKNSIIGNNTGGNCFFDLADPISALGASLDTDGSCGQVNFKHVTLAKLNLGPRALNPPGTTETCALLPGSAATDAANDCTDVAGRPVTTDQRGVPRPDFGVVACDIGAYESQETFAGTPGSSNCHGKSISALAKRYGGLDAAASALHFPSVRALQAAINAYCGGRRSGSARAPARGGKAEKSGS